MTNDQELEVGYNLPARPGMAESDIQTPCLVIDLDAFEHNIETMRRFCERAGVRLRAHAKMHKSADVARYQMAHGGACGICCQKVSEAEAFARAGIRDILITNEVRDPGKLDRLARLPLLGARIGVCVDDLSNVAELSEAASRHGTVVECLVEVECGGGRCGVAPGRSVVELAKAIAAANNLIFAGLQAYNGSAQHVRPFEDRKAAAESTGRVAADMVALLAAEGIVCESVTGGGTGSYMVEAGSGIYNELQCGSYAFMDADYGRIFGEDGRPLATFRNALFVLTSIMSHAKADLAICDAGLKAHSVDSGLPIVFGRDDVEYIKCSDEHGVIRDTGGTLRINERLRLVPGHCDPTCNLHDWFVGVRNGRVECIWPVTARGFVY
ncbi:MAG: hypothetical protein RLZ98_3717 [Pseudomonadota bacterium]